MDKTHKHHTGTPRHRWRHFQASIRDTAILLREFRTPLLWFSVAIIGGGILYKLFSQFLNEPVDSLVESIYTVLTLTFLQPPNRDFPDHIVLQLFHFLMPIIGIVVLAQGLADFGSLLFNRRARSKEWEMAVASTFNKHIILVGLGHLGYRIALKLHEMANRSLYSNSTQTRIPSVWRATSAFPSFRMTPRDPSRWKEPTSRTPAPSSSPARTTP